MLLLIFCFMLHPNLVIIPYMKDAHKLVAGCVLVGASTYRVMLTICFPESYNRSE